SATVPCLRAPSRRSSAFPHRATNPRRTRRTMGRQWLHSKREVTANRRAQITSKLVREIMVAAKMGVPDPAMNPRLSLAVEAARKQSVSNDVIQRAIKKGSGQGDEAVAYELVTYEGM